jgi:hypothetical protein
VFTYLEDSNREIRQRGPIRFGLREGVKLLREKPYPTENPEFLGHHIG